MKIYLIRHARQISSLCNVNVELAPEGIEQAHILGKRMKGSIPIDKLYCSDLIRAEQTASIIGEEIGIKPEKGIPGFREIDFGELTGLTDKEINTRYWDIMERRRKRLEDIPFPGGESGADVWNRAFPALMKVIRGGGENIAIVTHGGTIRSLVAGIMGLEQKDRLAISRTLENTSLTVVEYLPDKDRYTVETLNDYAHLSGRNDLMRSAIKRE